MMRLALVLLLAACSGAPPHGSHAPMSSDAPPGARWITPVLPWHLSDGSGAVVVEGNVALVAGTSRGEIEEIDLTTGARGRVHSVGKRMTITSMVRLSDGRYLIAGEIGDDTHAAILDATTFAPTWFPLQRIAHEKDAYATVSALELPDHSIAIVGVDLPLAAYDPTTLARTRVFDERATWTDLAVTKTTLLARHDLGASVRIDLATGKQNGSVQALMAARGDTLVERYYDKAQVRFRVTTGAEKRDLPTTLGFAATLDATGTRIASLRTGVVTVYDATTASVLGRFDLSPQTTFAADFVFSGDKLVIASTNTLRVADLATGALTSLDEPYGPYPQIAVDNNGTITAIGAEVWRYTDGALASTASLGKQTSLVTGTPLSRFATRTSRPIEPGLDYKSKFPSVIIVKTLEGRPIRELSLPRETDGAWIGTEGKLIASYKWGVDQPQKLVRAQGSKLFDIVTYNTDAMIDDIDVDGGIAAFSLGGTATLLDTTTGAKTHEVFNPNCAEFGSVELERNGERVLATDDKDAILYDRVTGKAVGSARFSDSINNTVFLPDEESILVRLDDLFVLWDPATNATRSLTFPGAASIHVSPNKKYAAFAMRDGRLALVDFAALLAQMKPGATLPKLDVPKSCSERDPFDLRDPTEQEDDQTDIEPHDDDLEGDDEEEMGD